MDEYIGMIKLFSGNFAPQGWVLCNGALLSIRENQAVYAVLTNKFGGDGITNFAVPKLDSPLADTIYVMCVNGVYPPRP